MTLAGTIRAMMSAGCTPDQIAAVVAAHEEEAKKKKAVKRKKNAERMRLYRAERAQCSAHDANVRAQTECARTTLSPKKEKSPTPSKEKTTPIPWMVSDETIVDAPVDVSDFKDLAKVKKGNVELFQTVVGLWNDLATSYHLVACRDITTKRQSAILARSEDLVKTYDFPDALEGWRKLMGLVRGSPFLRGETTGFRCDFDFVTRASSFTKIMEGKYEAQKTPPRWKGR